MTAPRPTRALLDQREQQLHDATRKLGSVQTEVAELREQRDHLAARTEPEAAAIALCVKALDEMLGEQEARRRAAQRNSASFAACQDPNAGPPPASATPVGRVLLYLAARYGVPLAELEPDPDPEPQGDDIVFAPPGVARKLERALRGDPYLLDRLR